MSQSDVFRPSNGPLVARGTLEAGMAESSDNYRKPSMAGSRPGSQSGYRFGQLSHSSFFARHNPHPGRVRHIKGLLDIPICAVQDDGYFANPRYKLNFPPNAHDQAKLKYSVPVNAINVNSQLHPINTITGLQKFVGNPLNMRIFREGKNLPKLPGIGSPGGEAWRDELRALTDAVQGAKQDKGREVEHRPRTSQYSAETGRLIPPPSRAMSRGASRQQSRAGFMNKLQALSEDGNFEETILQMLCQILQTDDINSVQSWLLSAGDREKSLVLDMIRAAMVSNEEYHKQVPEYVEDRPMSAFRDAGKTIGGGDNHDRLTLDNGSPRVLSRMDDNIDDINHTGFPDVFRAPPRSASRPRSRGDRPVSSMSQRGASPILTSEPKLRYTQTPIRDQGIRSQQASLGDILEGGDAVWEPEKSY